MNNIAIHQLRARALANVLVATPSRCHARPLACRWVVAPDGRSLLCQWEGLPAPDAVEPGPERPPGQRECRAPGQRCQ